MKNVLFANITAREFSRLDGIILDRAFVLDTITTTPTITAL